MNPAAVMHLPTPRPAGEDTTEGLLPVGVRIGIALLVVWTVAQIVAMVPSMPLGIRRVLITTKVLIGPGTLLLLVAIARPSLNVPAALRGFLVFSALSALNLSMRNEPNLARAALCIAWAACFVIVPGVLNSPARIHLFVRWSARSMLMAVLFAVLMAVSTGDFVESVGDRTRYHFGMNPNYFAMLSAILAFGGLAAHALEPRRSRITNWSIIALGVGLTVLTNSRTQILMLIVIFTVYGMTAGTGIWRRLCQGAGYLGGVAMLIAVLLVGTTLLPFETANTFSSGRLLLWSLVIKSNLQPDAVVSWVWGNGAMQFDYTMVRGIDYLANYELIRNDRVSAIFSRRSCDNSYLDILVTTGAVTLAVGLYAWMKWWRYLSGIKRSDTDQRVYVGLAKALIAGTLVSAFFASRWPAMGSLVVTYGLVLSIGLTSILTQKHQASAGVNSSTPDKATLNRWNPPGRLR